MNARSQAELAVGLLGVWAMIQAVVMLSGSIVLLASTNRGGVIAPMVLVNIPSALMLIVGYLMVRQNEAAVHFLFPRLGAPADVAALDLSVVLVGCLGLFIVATAIPSLLRTALMTYATDEQFQSPMLRASGMRTMAGSAIQAALGAYIALRPRHVLSLWKR